MRETRTAAMRDLLRSDPDMAVWWASRVECVSALARVERAGAVVSDARERLTLLSESWHEIEARDHVRRLAERSLRVHTLRAADALQLAAAMVASEDEPDTLQFVTLDSRLADAASREGFEVIDVAS